MTGTGTGNEVAIIGLAGRFPGAPDVRAFWQNLRDGVESISFFDPEELESSALIPEDARQQAGFVPAGGVLPEADGFDNDLFGVSPREARWMDPQHRVFLETAWAALEDAGYDPGRYPGRIAMYAGAGTTAHLASVMASAGSDPASLYEALSGDNIATRVSYALRLRGESVMVQTACSTGLAVVHMAAQSLLLGQSSIALAGAVRVALPQRTGYVYADGMILSPDGHCRAFDHQAGGTVSGNGAGIVVLKRLEDAVTDGDQIYAVIEGSAINNEGHRGVGYTAPSVAGQAEVITEALAFAEVGSQQISYVEAHGTGTPLGDPIEIAALTRAYEQTGSPGGDCAIGSVKTNVGHLDTAAGIAGLIKVALMLRHGEIPPSLHLDKPNPSIDFDGSPFFVNTSLRSWASPRRAGVSSFGIGGTNVHAVVAEGPQLLPSEPSSRPHHLITLSANTPTALTTLTSTLATHLSPPPLAPPIAAAVPAPSGDEHALSPNAASSLVTSAPSTPDQTDNGNAPSTPDQTDHGNAPSTRASSGDEGALVADVAYTRAVGRAPLRYRRTVVAGTAEELADGLRKESRARLVEDEPRVGLLFPGQGSAWHGMAAELYHAELAFREELDRVVAELEPRLGRPVLPVLLDGSGPIDDAELAHAGIFAVEYALARLWLGWGVRPSALLGHSFGEYAAAAVAGVLSLKDAAGLAVTRGRLASGLPEGGMLAVGLDEAGLAAYIDGTDLSLAAVNGAGRCVVSGPLPTLTELRKRLDGEGQASVSLPVRYAFHSAAVEAIMSDLAAAADRVVPGTPELPLVSSLTGTWWTERDGSGEYWARQLREPVRFAAGLDAIAATDGPLVLIEVGADQALTTLARGHLRVPVIPSLRRQSGRDSDHRVLLQGVGAAWCAGVPIDWEAFYRTEKRRRVELPAYPFERRTFEPLAGAVVRRGTDDGRHTRAPEDRSSATHPYAEGPMIAGAEATVGDSPDEVERRVFEIWRERLGIDDFGVHDNFLELGGNSLMAAQVLTRLRDAFGIPIPLEALFEAPTVAGIAERIRAIQTGGAGERVQLPPITPVPRDGELPLSVVQSRTLAMEAADPGNPQLVMPAAIKLDGRLDLDALRRAVNAVVERHETLRTTFHNKDGTWAQRIGEAPGIPLDVEEATDEQAERIAREEPRQPFDLAVSPVRFRLLRLAEDRHVLLVTVHHVVCDTWSLANLMGEIAAVYRDPSPLPPPGIQYVDFAAWQREVIGEPGPVRELTDSGARGNKLPAAIEPELSEQVRRFGSTGFVTLLAAYAIVLSRRTGNDKLVIGTPIGNRNLPELEPLIGYVAHAIPLHVDLSGDPSFADLTERLQQMMLSAYANADVPYEARAGLGRMFDALLVVHSGIASGEDVPGGRWTLWDVPDMPAMFGPTMSRLSMMMVDAPDGFSGAMEYAEEFDPAEVTDVFDRFTEVLRDAMNRPTARISTLAGGSARSTPERTGTGGSARLTPDKAGRRRPRLSLSFFANDEDALEGPKYRLLIEAAKLADRLGFASIWTPERHFHPFGGLYPSPTAINAGLATVTENLGLRAGSVVLPLHDPIRVAEEWSVIDNLSGGRAGISFASGWNVNDFVLAPDGYQDRRERMREDIDVVRRLWRGESVTRRNGIGEDVEIRIRPRPIQPELPFWVTAAGAPATFQLAGELGGSILTNLMGQTLDALADKIETYRKAWREAGHQGGGHVTLMLHAFLADDEARSYELARQPLLDYFRSSVDIIRGMLKSFGGHGQGLDIRPEDLTEQDLQALLEHGLARYLRDGGLFGTPATSLPMLERVHEIGVDEVAALIDFGVPVEPTLRSVELLGELIAPPAPPLSFAQQRLWYLEQLTPQNIAYNNQVALRLRGRLDIAALHRALQEVVRRHEVLRTTFESGKDGAVQVTAPELAVDLPVTDATEEDVADLAREHVRTPFDLAAGPLLKARLLRLSEDHHVLLVNMHHIVSDGWSAGVMLTELATLYMGAPLPELTSQYADYAVWQRELVESGALNNELDYWRTTLAGVPMLELPTDRPRTPVQGHVGARQPVSMDRHLTDALHELCRRHGATPYMVLHAGLTALLHRYSGQTDVAIGTAVAGRNRPETEQLIGCFVNSVVIRTEVGGELTFGQLLQRVKDSTLGALAHAELPFERLVDELKVPRSLSHSPLFQAMLVLHNTPSPKVELGGLSLEAIPVDAGLSKLDLMLELREEPDGITGSFEYNTDLFDATTVEQLAVHLTRLLSEATNNPDLPLDELELLSDTERDRLAELSTGAPLDVDLDEALAQHETVDAVLRAQVERTPDAPAVGDLTYRELLQAANRIAHGLRARGVGRGSVVGLLIDQPGLAVTAVAGVILAGGAYLPMDPASPPARLATIVDLADPVVVLTDSEEAPDGIPVVSLDELTTGQPGEAVPGIAEPADPAYVMFTSGSTGVPKGVVVEHGQLLFSTRARRSLCGPAGICLSLQPLTFDPSTGWIWYSLLTGGTLWRVRPEVVSDPQALAGLIERRGITHMGAVPALYGQLLAGAAPGQLDSLRVVHIGGEAMPPEVIRAHAETLPSTRLYNMYGPVEATMFCVAQRVDQYRGGRVPIGRPRHGDRSHVLDRRRRPVPVGAVGELYVGGPGIARGYLGSPELTAERFVEVDGERLYRTGDRSRWNHAGLLEFFGRVDRQVKIRGMRIEPAEVEAVLAGHPDVTEAAVIPSGGRLIGYVVAPGASVDEIHGFAKDKLPEYLVPAHLVPIPSLPRTPHGKLDVAALPSPAAVSTRDGTPRSEREEVLAGIFADVLGRAEVGVHDDFYELGGDSILAISVVTRARERGIELAVRQMVQSPTVAGLAAVAGTRLGRPADQRTIAGPVPLTPIQRWFFDQDFAEPWHWNEAVQLELTEPVREALLQEAFRALLDHHDALRLRFTRQQGRWSARIAPAEASWELGRISSEDADAFQADCDLANGPLLRAAMIGPDRLLVVAHHLVVDGVSWRILLTDLFSAYRALVAGRPIGFPPKTTSYAEWARRLPETLSDVTEIGYWNRLVPTPLPRDGSSVLGRAVVKMSLDPDRTRTVLESGALGNMLTALGQALTSWTGGDQVVLDVGHHGREDLVPGLDVVRTVGWFSGHHPVLVPGVDAAPHNGAGFIPLLAAGLVDVPPSEILFTYLGQLDVALPPEVPARILDEIPGRLRSDNGNRLIEITAGVLDGRLWFTWSYTEGIHHRETIARLAESTLTAL